MNKMNIKGRCRIELTDVCTGRKEIEEHDNMITKALEYFYGKGGFTNPSAMNASILRTNALYYMLGGVMCLDTALTESNEIVRVPAGVKMTANGARDQLNSGNPSELGSFNQNESGWQQDGSLKMVWDWTQSQGNGDIKCVCLSSVYGGFNGIGNPSNTSKANPWTISNWNSATALSGISGIPLAYKNNRVYALEKFDNVTEWTINIYEFPYSVIDMRATNTARLVNTITVQIPASIQNLVNNYSVYSAWGYGEEYSIHQNGDDVYILLCCTNTGYQAAQDGMTFSDSYPAYAIKYTISTGTVTVTTLTPTTTGLSAINPSPSAGYYFNHGISSKYAIIDDYMINLANLADVSEFTNAEHTTSSRVYDSQHCTPMDEDVFRINGAVYDTANKTRYACNGSLIGGIGNMSDNPLMRFNGSALYRDLNYIATIFNLSSPVTKTADKTMKVTYILRFN